MGFAGVKSNTIEKSNEIEYEKGILSYFTIEVPDYYSWFEPKRRTDKAGWSGTASRTTQSTEITTYTETKKREFFDAVATVSSQHRKEQAEYLLLHKWWQQNALNSRVLQNLRNEMHFCGTRISLESAVSDLEEANRMINKRISELSYSDTASVSKIQPDEFVRIYAKELLLCLAGYLKNNPGDRENAVDIVHDMKKLTGDILEKKHGKKSRICTDYEYSEYLQSLSFESKKAYCPFCRFDTVFTEYRCCLFCGKERVQ